MKVVIGVNVFVSAAIQRGARRVVGALRSIVRARYVLR